ncbi:MAG: GTP-binding protein [Planctomycetes bacterium]|nr:GTP-binding protein [Planctomycetota bacterium]
MDRLRTFGIVAHIDAGKTTLTERILHDTGAQSFVGSVDEGTAAMDWMPLEKSRGISVTAAATRVTWNEHTLQIVDTPGHVDFTAEVERCLHVLDGVVVVVDGVRGIESQTEAVWRQAESRRLPRLVFVNKLDRPGADFAAVTAELAERFERTMGPVVVPFRDAAGAFAGIGHAVTGAVQWFEGAPEAAIVPRLRAELAAAHDRLVEIAADADEAMLADVIAGRAITAARLLAVLQQAQMRGCFTPVYSGAALWNRGVDWLLDGVVSLLPPLSAVERAGIWSVEGAGDPSAPFCGLVFKVQHAEATRNYVRVVRGRLTPGSPCRRCRESAREFVVPELWSMMGESHRVVDAAGPGEIVVLPGDFGMRTGETLVAPGHPVSVPVPRFPAPVLAVTFEPERDGDGPVLLAALRELAVDDPTLRVDHSHGQITVRGMGELHLDVIAEVLAERTEVPFKRSQPRVAQREGVAGPGGGEAEVRAVVGGRMCAARCRLRLEPRPESSTAAATIENGAAGEFGAVAEAEVLARLLGGLRVGPMVGFAVTVEEVELSEPVDGLVEQAALRAFELAVERAGAIVLEPRVQFEVTCPEDGGAAVLADLGARNAEVASVASGRLGARILGSARLSSMLGYVTRLRSITKGLGQASLRPAGFAPVDK